MKKLYRVLSFSLIIMGIGTQAQVKYNLFTTFGSAINDINDVGIAITRSKYYNYNTDTWTNKEIQSQGLVSINNNGDVAGQMYYDENAFTFQPAYLQNGIWKPIGWFPESVPGTSGFTTCRISNNSKFVTGQMSKEVNNVSKYGIFYYKTETSSLEEIFDDSYVALAGYSVNNNGIISGWADNQLNGSTNRIPAYITPDHQIHLIYDPTIPSQAGGANDINDSNFMVGELQQAPFTYDINTGTLTRFEIPEGYWNANFVSVSENNIAIGYAQYLDSGGNPVRDAIIYHPSLGSQPVFLKDLLAQHGININTSDGLMGTGYSISPNGRYVGGWIGSYIFGYGWLVDLDTAVLNTKDINKESNISVYPNPVKDIIHVKSDNKIDNIQIFDLSGKRLKTFDSFINQEAKMDLSSLILGTYIMTITGKGKSQTTKIIKE